MISPTNGLGQDKFPDIMLEIPTGGGTAFPQVCDSGKGGGLFVSVAKKKKNPF